jgi:hypothetical protein
LTVTINTNNFEWNTNYYTLIDSWSFKDIAWNNFTGISDKNYWNFTTIDNNNIPEISENYYTWVTNNSATMWWTVVYTWNSNIIEHGIYRSTINWFSDWLWTKISEYWNWSNTWNFTLNVSGLPSGTHIFFKSFAKNNDWIWYAYTQSDFFTKPDAPTLYITDTSNKSFRVNWNHVTWASSYELYIAKDINFIDLVTGHDPLTGITNNTINVQWLETGTNYFAKIVAINSGGSSLQSNITNTTTTQIPNATVHLKFEELVWSIAYDSVWTHDWVIEWSPTRQQTWINWYTYALDWLNDKISIIDFNYWPELSIYFWIKKSSANDNEHIFSHWAETDPSSINVYFDNTNQKLITSINGNTWALPITGWDYTWLLNNERHLYVLTLDYSSVTGKVLSKVYIDWNLKVSDSSTDAPESFDPTTNIVLWRRWQSPTDGTYYSWYIDDFRIYNQYLLDSEVQQLYISTLDDTPPTATIEYMPWSWQYTTSNVTATLTWFSESWVIITNNLGSNTYIFTENWNFTFEYKDPAWNTWQSTATITRIVTWTLWIWTPNNFTFSWIVKSQTYSQELTWQFSWNNYFFVDDQLWLDNGRYTTISSTDLSWNIDMITNNNLFIQRNQLEKLEWDDNGLVEINSLLDNYTPLSWQIIYIFRNTANNLRKKWKYWDKPYLKINIPWAKPANNYHSQLIFTIYEY